MDCVERAAQRRFRFFVTIFKFSVVLLNRFANVFGIVFGLDVL